jgi:hypothetical protein
MKKTLLIAAGVAAVVVVIAVLTASPDRDLWEDVLDEV